MFILFSVLIITLMLRLQNKEMNSYAVSYAEKFYLSYIVTCLTVI